MKIVSTLSFNEDAPIVLELDGGEEEPSGQTLELSVADAAAISQHLNEAVLNHSGREQVELEVDEVHGGDLMPGVGTILEAGVWTDTGHTHMRFLFIGGGGLTLPRRKVTVQRAIQ